MGLAPLNDSVKGSGESGRYLRLGGLWYVPGGSLGVYEGPWAVPGVSLEDPGGPWRYLGLPGGFLGVPSPGVSLGASEASLGFAVSATNRAVMGPRCFVRMFVISARLRLSLETTMQGTGPP